MASNMEQFQTLASEFDGVAPLGNWWQVIWYISIHWRMHLTVWHLWAIDGKEYGTVPNTGKWIWWGGTPWQLMASNMEHFQPLASEFPWVAHPGKLMASSMEHFQTLVSEFDGVAPLGNWWQVIWNISNHWQVNLMGWHLWAIDGKSYGTFPNTGEWICLSGSSEGIDDK
jgi:hypothetical protein